MEAGGWAIPEIGYEKRIKVKRIARSLFTIGLFNWSIPSTLRSSRSIEILTLIIIFVEG
jgi:hypothetical protein